MISMVDVALFLPPLLIGAGVWITVFLSERSFRLQREREQRQGPAE